MAGRGGGRYAKPGARDPAVNRGPAVAGAVYLPRAGREGPPPPWPLPEQSDRERQLWTRLWATPAATMWEQLGWADVVARYARVLAEAEAPAAYEVEDEDGHGSKVILNRAAAESRAEARQLEDRLGLSPIAMLRLRWVITESPAVAEERESVVDVRSRLRLA
jgi:hypothetical protein